MFRIKQTFKKSGFVVSLVQTARAGVMDLKRLSWLAARPGKIETYLKANPVRKLQVGTSHTPLAGWLNTDVVLENPEVVYLDATLPFPFQDNIFDYVACEHMIEHVDHAGALVMLRESFRVLKPGGRIRLATPNLKTLAGLIAAEKSAAQSYYIDWIVRNCLPEASYCKDVFVLNNAFRAWGHQFIYDPETLKTAMTRCGFEDLADYTPGVSDDPNLRGLEAHGRLIGDEGINQFETFIVEGRVPRTKSAVR